MTRRSTTLACALLLVLASCSSDDDKGSEMSHDAMSGHDMVGASVCSDYTDLDDYAANLEKKGASDALTFRLVSSVPGPPEKGDNEWTLNVLDGAGELQKGCTLKASPFMPEHGHPTPTNVEITEADGVYSLKPVDLFMAGLWEVTLEATCGAATDTVKLKLCIEG